ncbi:hypothetical protein Tco_0269431 [Tanacetum coccineum]
MYEWGKKEEKVFQTLKNNLCDAPILSLPDGVEDFVVYCEAIESRLGKANVVTDALSRKERVKPRRVRAMAMTIQYGVRGMILAAQSEAFKQENVPLVGSEMDEAHASSGRKMTVYEVGENVFLKVSPWKGVMRFGKKGKLAPRYVGPFEILERIGPVAYRLRFPEELIGVHDTFHVSNLKKCLGNANLHVSLNEIKIVKTLRFVEEPVEIMDREVKSLKRSRIPLVKVHWNSKRGPEFTWEREDYIKSKYPQLFVDRAVEPTS